MGTPVKAGLIPVSTLLFIQSFPIFVKKRFKIIYQLWKIRIYYYAFEYILQRLYTLIGVLT